MLTEINKRFETGDVRMGRIETKLDGRPCISQQGPCPTQQVPLPPAAPQIVAVRQIPPDILFDEQVGTAVVKLGKAGLSLIAAHWGKGVAAILTAASCEAFHAFFK